MTEEKPSAEIIPDKQATETAVNNEPLDKDNGVLTRTLFLRSLGLVYFIAFISYYVQALGLNGADGIIPAHRFLEVVSNQSGWEKFWFYPTCFWLNCSDLALQAVPLLCAILSLCVVAGIASGLLLPILWFCYLSILTVGGDFMTFQWDILLLEAGFLSLFYADFYPFDCFWARGRGARCDGGNKNSIFSRESLAPPVVMSWLFRLLIFKLMFLSGCCKLASMDETWWNLTALQYHYWTQPLPTPAAWLAAQMPDWFLKLSCLGVFVTELLMPFLVWGGGRCRLAFALATIFLQIIIMITGNYTFFNILTIFLCLPIVDDRYVASLLQFAPSARPSPPPQLPDAAKVQAAVLERILPADRFRKTVTVCFVSFIVLLNWTHTFGRSFLTRPAREFVSNISQWNLVNSYGLFAMMTTTRKEIIVEGSDDARNWIPYAFRFKPGDLHRAPPIVAPFQPRLDWQMWFAALGTLDNSPWFTQFMFKLLQGSRDVENLLASKPFPDHAPKYIRARMEDYRFTDLAQMQKSGNWWKSSDAGIFFPPAAPAQKRENHFKLNELPDPNDILRQ